MLENFKIDTARDLLIPDVEFYQMDLSRPVFAAIKAGEFNDLDIDELPSWQKFMANPLKAKGFFHNILNAIFNGTEGGYNELNADEQFADYECINNRTRVAMMFLPEGAGCRTDMLLLAGKIARDALPNYEVIVLCGKTIINGRKVSNKTAEKAVFEAIERAEKEGKNVLILSSKMAQRSFSIPHITELYLAYDNGSKGGTIQKMSRALTPDNLTKVGRIISLSFDMNRDDKFDAIILETAVNYRRTHKMKSAKEAVRDVLRTIDIFHCTIDGSIKIDGDTYLENVIANKSVFRVIGRISNLTLLTMEEIAALAKGNNDYFKLAVVDPAEKGKTRKPKNRTKKMSDKKADNMFQKAREVITTIVENLDIIILGTNSSGIQEGLDTVENNETMKADVEAEFRVGFETIKAMFDRGVINQELVELIYDS